MENTEFMKYPKIYAVDNAECEDFFKGEPTNLIVAEEKIDGANTRVMIKDSKIIFGSHNRPLDNPEDEKFFQRFIQHIKKKVIPEPRLEGFIFYGEMCVKHTISYDWERIPPYLGFDVYDLSKKQFLDHIDAMLMFKSIGLEFVPILWVKRLDEIGEVSEKMIPPSAYWLGTSEGIVFKDYKRQIFTKLVAEKFKEKNKEVFGLTKKQARVKGDEELLVATYATNARIDKKVFELISEGHELAMTMMQELPRLVTKDIYEESYMEILNGNFQINTRQLRILITKRCLAVLKNIITNNELSKGATPSV